jgi:hypothetical protein
MVTRQVPGSIQVVAGDTEAVGLPPNIKGVLGKFTVTPMEDRQQWLKILVYGLYGVGKTHFGGSTSDVSAMQDVLWLDVEGGTETIRKRSNIDVIRIANTSQINAVYQFLRLHAAAWQRNDTVLIGALQQELGLPMDRIRHYRTVVIDSISELDKLIMYQLLGIEVGKQSLAFELQPAEIKQWGQNAEMFRLLIRSFRDLPMHTIFIGAADVAVNSAGDRYHSVLLPGKLAREVPGFMDVVAYLTIVRQALPDGSESPRSVRRLMLQPGRNYDAKNRLNSDTVPYLDNPTMLDLVKLCGLS